MAHRADAPRPTPPTGSAEVAGGGASATIPAWRQSANCWVSFFEISGSKPRDICAAAPVSVMSACILTVVLPGSAAGSSHDVTEAFAAPLPFCSMPVALSTTRCAASSRSCIDTVPANDIDTGPNFAWTVPFHVRSSIVSFSSAPGMHGAIFSTSSR